MLNKPKTEQKFQKQIIDLLNKQYNSEVIKVIMANKSGIPDIIACIDGRFVSIEVKLDSKTSPLQEAAIKRIVNAGGNAFVLRWSENWQEELKTRLKNER